MFLDTLRTDPLFYVSVVATCVVSIILHELAHGMAAIRQGDDTPIRLRRMTLNPLVHMGGFSLLMLVVAGIAYGQMPVNPHRFRSRYGPAIVAFAGPAANLALAGLALTALGLWERRAVLNDSVFQANLVQFLWIFGITNIVLFLFNLFPVPPLDGSRILANFHDGYGRLVDDPSKQHVFFAMFVGVFILSNHLFDLAINVGGRYLDWVTRVGL